MWTQDDIARRRREVREVMESSFNISNFEERSTDGVADCSVLVGSTALENGHTLECILYTSAALTAKIYSGEVAPNREDIGVYLNPPWISPTQTVVDVRKHGIAARALVDQVIVTYGYDPAQIKYTNQ